MSFNVEIEQDEEERKSLQIVISARPTLFDVNDVLAVVNRTLEDQIPVSSEIVDPEEEIDPETLITVPSENDRTPEVTVFRVLTRP